MEFSRSTIATNQTMEWTTAMTKRNHMEKKTTTTNPKIVGNVKCNNVNANLNGFNGVQVGTLPTALNGLATDNEAQASADEGEIGASSSGSNDGSRPSGHDSDSRVVCIYNNNNIVLEGETIRWRRNQSQNYVKNVLLQTVCFKQQ